MTKPTVAGGWVAQRPAHPMSAPGITGHRASVRAHDVQGGRKTIGTTDYQKDLENPRRNRKKSCATRCAKRRPKMRAAYRRGDVDDLMKPESKTPRWNEP